MAIKTETMTTRPPLPPFTRESAIQKVRLAEDGWNTRDPGKVALAYAIDSRWRNRSEFINGRSEIIAFLSRKWARELEYRLIKEMWAFTENRIAVRFAYEWHDDSGHWYRSVRAVINGIVYLLRTGCQWRLLPHQVIMDGQSVKTTERSGTRGFDGYKRVKGRKRHILVNILGLLVANRVEPANTSDRRAGARLLAGLSPLFPRIKTVIAGAGHESRRLARELMRQDGWKVQIVKRSQRAFKIIGLTWIVERTFAWLGRNRRSSKDYEYRVQTSETLLDIAATRLMLNRLAPA